MNLTRGQTMLAQVAAGWRADDAGATIPVIWLIGEVTVAAEWLNGGSADVALVAEDGAALATARMRLEKGVRTFRVELRAPAFLSPGRYTVRLRLRLDGSDLPISETAPFVLERAPQSSGAVLVRRGLSTGNREVVTADPRFRRTEQLRVEVLATSDDPGTARLLDRTGKPMAIPVAAGVRAEPDGTLWRTAQLSLAPLAPGDYVVELSGEASPRGPVLVAFRIVQ
ncbi:MAG: hypothetical protein AB1806_21745 [Acidobacteriota bacterium]